MPITYNYIVDRHTLKMTLMYLTTALPKIRVVNDPYN